MNPLPNEWTARVRSNPQALAFVVVDAAMQPLLAERITACAAALSLLPAAPKEARDLGPWLIDAATAINLGVDGCGRGVNWLLTHYRSDAIVRHLASWTSVRLPGEAGASYIRIADSRVLRSLLSLWSGSQRSRFFAPTIAWCAADRDGNGFCIHSAAEADVRGNATPALCADQYKRLLADAYPDQVLHELKGHVRVHSDWPTRESRHSAASHALQVAEEIGYTEPEDLMAVVAAVITHGKAEVEQLPSHSAVKARLGGADLWAALVERTYE